MDILTKVLVLSAIALLTGVKGENAGSDLLTAIGVNQTTYTIATTWNNQTVDPQDQIKISLSIRNETTNSKNLFIEIDAPFYNDPLAPDANTSVPFPGLWDYEVVEAFFLGNDEEYLEIELAPSGHYLLLYLKGYRNDTNVTLPLTQFTTHIFNTTTEPFQERWHGEAYIPGNYFPCNVTTFNAYAISRSGDNRTYMSLFPVAEMAFPNPDFHKLDAFGPIEFDKEVNPTDKCRAGSAKTVAGGHFTWMGILLVTTVVKFFQ